MKTKHAILIIDAQYDFCNPQGALFVPGADADTRRLSEWIKFNRQKIDHIILSMDSHPVNDISHPSFWSDKNGNFPPPFTPITLAHICEGTWVPRFSKEEATRYIETLEKQGEFGHFIWPFHCLTGSRGAALDDNIMGALKDWALEGKNYQVVEKGSCPLTEHFGIFRANVPIVNQPETQLNTDLIATLNKYQHIYIAGEAKSHCVSNSLKQAMDEAPELAKKFIILEDCMSDVTNLGYLGEPVYKRAKEMGIRFATTKETIL